MTRRYYRTEISESSIASNRLDASRAQLSRQSVLGGGGRVKRISGEASDIRLDVDYRGRYAERMAQELREILSSNDIEAASFAAVEASQPSDAYYTAELVDDDPVMPQAAGAISVGANLTEKGTRNTHWVGVEVSDSDDLTNPYGTTSTSLVGIPSSATRVQTVNSQSSPTDRVTPTPTQTVTAQHGDVDLINTADLPGSNPTLLYDLPYDAQGDIDPGVWDTHGHSSIRDEDGVVAWQRVFNTAHEFDAGAECVLENGLLRVRLDEPDAGDQTASLTAERWDTATDSWTSVDLPSYSGELATEWVPVDVDLTQIGQASIHALVEFEAVAGTNAGDVFRVDLRLFRGWDDLLVTIPSSESGPLPPALYDRLEPIASTRVVDPGVEQTLVERQEVR
ncbi:hypothetical protein DJ68_17305 [Halorubrum sp. C3]|nr:hypothetical protein DJ68_17305 [Halorubrum sp. C3]